MRNFIYTIAAVGALTWSGTAWAILEETTITLTDHGKPLPEATITLNRLTDSQTPPEPKTEKTDDSGKIVIVHEEDDKTSDSTVEIIVHTSEGKTIARRVVLKELLVSETFEMAAPSVTEHVSQSLPSETAQQCEDLTILDDSQLEILIKDPALRARLVRLMEETEESEQTEESKESETSKQPKEVKEKTGTTKKSVSTTSKKKKEEKSTASAKRKPIARELLGTGIGVGIGIAGSRGGSKKHKQEWGR